MVSQTQKRGTKERNQMTYCQTPLSSAQQGYHEPAIPLPEDKIGTLLMGDGAAGIKVQWEDSSSRSQ